MKETSAKRLEKEDPLFRDLLEGTKYVLNALGKAWKRDLNMPKVRIYKNQTWKIS